MANPLKYIDVPIAQAPAPYVAPTYVAPTNTAKYVQPTYTSKYADKLDTALQGVTNFQYDPLKDASYQALAKVYTKRGEHAAKNTMADAAMLNGGLGTSYATSAAQQMRNDYNAELASLIPDLEEKAYNRNVQTLAALGDAEDRDYGRYRDTVGDAQWKYGVDYQAYRDNVADAQWKYGQDNENAKWKYSQDYQNYRDTVADAQWARNYNLDIYGLKKAGSGGGGGGGRRGGGGGGGGYAGSGSSGSGNTYMTAAKVANAAKNVSKIKYDVSNKSTKKQLKQAGVKLTKGKTDPKLTVSKVNKKIKGGGGHAK